MAGVTTSSVKRALIDKANARIVIYVGVAAFILVFSLVAIKTLMSQAAYQNRLISQKKETVAQLKTNIAATDKLEAAYEAFTQTSQNVLGGDPAGTGNADGNNAKIILDALPNTYDFPGLTTSLETLLGQQSVSINSISGTDDEVAQSANQSSVNPQPVPIPFTTSVEGDYAAVQNVIGAFEKSIRPMQIQTLSIAGSTDKLTLNISAQTFYQPAKSLSVKKEVIK